MPYFTFTDVSHNPPSPKAVDKVSDKPSEVHVQNATKQMLRDLSTHVNDSDSDSGEDLPVVNLSQTVDALTLPRDWEPMDINAVGTQLSGKPISTKDNSTFDDFQQYYIQRSHLMLAPPPPILR